MTGNQSCLHILLNIQTHPMDIQSIRQQCQATSRLLHFNNAGSALSPDVVTRAVIDYLELEQQVGGYEAARARAADIESFYTAMAQLLACSPAEIAYVENATRAWDQALYAIDWQAGDEILTGDMEYASNYMGLLHLTRQTGVTLRIIPSDSHGLIDLPALQAAIGAKTRMIALTHVASQRGDIQPAEAVGALAREHDLLYLLDACQSAGQIPLDVERLQCDFLCGTGRKYLRGPRGTGFLYVRQSRLSQLDPVFVDLHAATWKQRDHYVLRPDARRFENFERFVAGQIGLATAVSYALQLGIPQIRQRIATLVKHLRQLLAAQAEFTVHEQSEQLSGIVTLSSKSRSAEQLQQRLGEMGINTSLVRAANTQLDIGSVGKPDRLRASLHYYNTEEEIGRFVECLSAAQ